MGSSPSEYNVYPKLSMTFGQRLIDVVTTSSALLGTSFSLRVDPILEEQTGSHESYSPLLQGCIYTCYYVFNFKHLK